MLRNEYLIPATVIFAVLMAMVVFLIVYSGWISYTVGGNLDNLLPWSFLSFPDEWRISRPDAYSAATKAGIAGALTAFGGIVYALLSGNKTSLYGDARYARRHEIRRAKLLQDAGVILAKLPSPISRLAPFVRTRSQDYSNIMVTAPPGAGKTASLAIPTLLTYGGSVLCLDVKGELFDETARRREALGDTVFKFAPYAEDGLSHCYNPFAAVAELSDPERQFVELKRIAFYLLVAPGGTNKDWVEGARELFAAIASVVVTTDRPTIGHVFSLVAPLPDADKGGLGAQFKQLAARAPLQEARTTLMKYASFETKVLTSFISILGTSGLNAWGDPFVNRATSGDDIRFEDLRRDPATIYFCVNMNDMQVLAPLARLFFQHAIALTQRTQPKTGVDKFPVLFLMDEFHQLGKMEMVLKATTTLRSAGGRMMMIHQGIPWLREAYGKDLTDGILGVAQAQVYFSVTDDPTQESLSKAIGQTEVSVPRKSFTRSRGGTSRNYSHDTRGRRLITPDEIGRLGDQDVLILASNVHPIRAKKAFFKTDPRLSSLHSAQADMDPVYVPSLKHQPEDIPRLDGDLDKSDPETLRAMATARLRAVELTTEQKDIAFDYLQFVQSLREQYGGKS